MGTRSGIKKTVTATPILGSVARRISLARQAARFRGSGDYWEDRYRRGENSGAGSYGEEAEYKAGFLNQFVREHEVETVIEWGCGDGNQLGLAEYPSYIGIDVAPSAIRLCIERFGGDDTKSFYALQQPTADHARLFRADLALSLDVIYHLVEDEVFDTYMRNLFASADRFVIVYASNRDPAPGAAPHVRHRRFLEWVDVNAPDWRLLSSRGDREVDFFCFAVSSVSRASSSSRRRT